MCAERTRSQQIEDVRLQLVDYVRFRDRNGPPITYQRALLSHREQCEDNLADDPDGPWRERLSLLDALCSEEGL